MQEINFMIEKTDGTLLGFEDRDSFTQAVSNLIKRKEFRAGFSVSVIVREIHARDEQLDLIYSELRSSPKFIGKISKKGVHKDGTPRLIISIPKKMLEDTWLNTKSEFGIIITSPWVIREIGDDD